MKLFNRRSLGIALLLLMLVAGLFIGYVYVRFSDPELLRTLVVAGLSKSMPGAKIEIGNVEGCALTELRISGLSIKAPIEGDSFEEVARFERVIIHPDKSRLFELHWALKRLIFERPTLQLTRHADGLWTINAWRGKSTPKFIDPCELRIRDGNLIVADQPGVEPPLEFHRVNLTVNLKPPSAITWMGSLEHELARFETRGDLDAQRNFVRTTGTAKAAIDRSKLEPIARFLPAALLECGVLRGDCELNVSGSGTWGPDGPSYSGEVRGTLRNGALEHPRLPEPLERLEADFTADENGFVCPRVTGSAGPASINLECRLDRWDAAAVDLRGKVENLEFSPAVYDKLPKNWRDQWDKFAPEGHVDMSGWFQLRNDKPRYSLRVDFRDVACTPQRFPTRMHHIKGAARLRPDGKLELKVDGLVGDTPVGIEGALAGVRPDAGYSFDIDCRSMPIDDQLEAALPDHLREAYQKFAVDGVADMRANLSRDEGAVEGQFKVDADLRLNSIRCGWFNYPVDDVTGRITCDPEGMTFSSIKGRSGAATVVLEGSVKKTEAGVDTKVKVRAVDVPLDSALRRALVGISPRWSRTWDSLRPSGAVDVDCDIKKTPFDPVDVKVALGPANAMIFPTAFPYRLERFEGRVHHVGGRVFWNNLKFRHKGVEIECSGRVLPMANGGKLALEGLRCPNLPCDADLRAAMPSAFRSAFDFLDVDRPVDVNFRVFHAWWFDAEGVAPVIAFDGTFGVEQCRMLPALGVHGCSGRLDMLARFDGPRVIIDGNLDVDAMTVSGFTTRRATAKLVNEGSTLKIENINADLYKGRLQGSARVLTSADRDFDVRLTLHDARLSDYVKEMSRNPPSVAGDVDADLLLRGRAGSKGGLDGTGWIHVRNADIVRLPMLQQLFQIISLKTPDEKTFDDAYAAFRFRDREMLIDRMELTPAGILGPSLSLFNDGVGSIDLDSFEMRMNLALRYAKGRLKVPALTEALNLASDNLGKVRVEGSLLQPDYRFEPMPGLKKLLFGKVVDAANRSKRAKGSSPERGSGLIRGDVRTAPLKAN